MQLQLGVVKSGKDLLVAVKGSLTEFSDEALNSLNKHTADVVTFNFASLDHVNSSGIRIWAHFIKAFTPKHRVFFARCPEVFVSQILAISSVAKDCEVVSVMARYQCEGCRTASKKLYDFASMRQSGERIGMNDRWPCPHCGRDMVSLDDEDFFDFLSSSLSKT